MLEPLPPELRLPVTLITGFLGSGKTTLLNRLLTHPALAESAVIVNEFGEIGIDNALIEKIDGNTILLESGCVCCTVRDDLTATMELMLERRERKEIPPFRRLVIETTGLADPAPIINVMLTDPVVATQFGLGSVVTTIDAVNGMATLDAYSEAVSQVAIADSLVLTKTDLASPEETRAITARLNRINPAAAIIRNAEQPLEPEKILRTGLYNSLKKTDDIQAWLNLQAYPDHHHDHESEPHSPENHHAGHHSDDIHAWCLIREAPLTWPQLTNWLQRLNELKSANLLRVKGLVHVRGQAGPAIIHGVQRLIHLPTVLPAWPDADRRTRIVCIVKNIERQTLETMLDAACAAS